MYWVLGFCLLGSLFLIVPRMEISSPGEGVMASRGGTVTSVDAHQIVVSEVRYPVSARVERAPDEEHALVWPRTEGWQEPLVRVGDVVAKKQLLAKGITHIFFQANVWVFTVLVCIVGLAMGIGKAAVYKYIPEYFPREVGVVGGIVGVIGGLGGFVCPILFGYLLKQTGLWTSCWMVFFCLSLTSLVWLHFVVRKMEHRRTPHVSQHFEDEHVARAAAHSVSDLSGAPAGSA